MKEWRYSYPREPKEIIVLAKEKVPLDPFTAVNPAVLPLI